LIQETKHDDEQNIKKKMNRKKN